MSAIFAACRSKPVMDCSAKEHLLTAITEAVNALDRAIERLANFAGENKSAEFIAARRKVMELRPLAAAALRNYGNHGASTVAENPNFSGE
jgi:hypothetical protein